MPLYMRFEPLGGGSESDMDGGVSADGYEGWIALDSLNFDVHREDRTSGDSTTGGDAGTTDDGDEPPPVSVQPAQGSRAADVGQAALPAMGAGRGAQLAARCAARFSPLSQTRPTDATIGKIKVVKRADKASGPLFRWVAQVTTEGRSEDVRRQVKVSQIAMAADGLNFMESVLEFEFEDCKPVSLDVDMSDAESGPKETLVFDAAAVKMYFLGSGADGTVEDYYEEAEFRRDSGGG